MGYVVRMGSGTLQMLFKKSSHFTVTHTYCTNQKQQMESLTIKIHYYSFKIFSVSDWLKAHA